MAAPVVEGTPQSYNCTGNTATAAVTLTGVQSGELLIAVSAMFSGSRTVASVADDVNGNWSASSVSASTDGTGYQVAIWAYPASASGTVTVTATAADSLTGQLNFWAFRVSGCGASPSDDADSSTAEDTTCYFSAASGFNRSADTIVVLANMQTEGRSIITAPDAGGDAYTRLGAANNIYDPYIWVGYKTFTAAQLNYQPSIVYGVAPVGYAGIAASFTAAAPVVPADILAVFLGEPVVGGSSF